MSQLPIPWSGRHPLDEHDDDSFRLLGRLVDACGGLKEAAYLLDVAPSVLSHALRRRDRHPFREEWVTRLLEKAGRSDQGRLVCQEYIAHKASLCGLEVQRKRPLSPEEKLDALRESIRRNLGPELAAALLREAYE